MSSKRTTLIKALILAAAVWAVYWNSLANPFLFDDWHVIPQNPEVRGPADVPEFFTDVSKFSILPGNRDYRPLFLTSMALAWWAGDGSTVPFHLVGTALHMGNVLLLFFLGRILFSRDADPGSGLAGQGPEWAAFVAGLLWALHPLATEAVVYISSQSVPMAAFFYLLAFLLFVLLQRRASQPRPAVAVWATRLGSWLAYFLALLSKPIAITLPLVLALWEVLFGRRSEGGAETFGARLGGLWRRWRKHLPYVAVTLVYLMTRNAVVGNPVRSISVVAESGRDFWLYHLTQTRALVFYYLRLALWPVGQNVDVEYPRVESLADGKVLAALAVIVLAGVALWFLRRRKALVFFALWFPTCLLVTTYIVRLIQTVREARVYLSLAGVCAIAGFLAVALWQSLPLRVSDSVLGRRSGRAAVATALGAVVIALGAGTVRRNHVWSSGLTLWEDAASKNGTWRAHMNYALALEGNDPERALAEFQKAVELGPYAWSHLNLGLAYIRRGSNDLGLSHLRTAVRLWPESADVHFYLGLGLENTGDLAGAEREYRAAIERRPNYLLAHRYLGRLHERLGRPQLALASYRRLAELEPGKEGIERKIRALEQGAVATDAPGLFRSAFALQRAGQREQSLELYERLLALDPGHRQGTFNAAYAYLQGESEEDWSRAAELFTRVIEIDPRYTEAIFHLASAQWKLGQAAEARANDRLYLERGDHDDLKERSRLRLAEDSG